MTASQERKSNNPIVTGFNALVDWLGIRQSLTRRVSFIFTALIATALILSGSLVAQQSFRIQEQEILAQQVSEASQAAVQIESFVQRLRGQLNVLSSTGHGELAHFSEYVADVLNLEPAFLELIVVDAHGRIIDGSATGNVVLGNLFTIQQAQWFLQASAGKEYISGLQISTANEPYVILAQPVVVEGQVIGVIASRVDMRVLWETVADIEIGQSGLAYVVDQAGILIGHPDANLVLSGVNLATDINLETALNAPTETGFRFNGLSQSPAVGGSALIEGTDWRVIAELPVAEAFAASRRAIAIYIVSILTALIITFIALQLLVRRMARPIVELAAVTQQFGAGNADVALPTYREPDEMGQLVVAFGDMVQQVGTLTSGLEEQVAARTRDLASAAEISQRIAQVRDVDALLAESVELIRERFDLYHAQIYLTDISGRTLVLKASSGAIGESLLQRGHRLPIDLSSINGTAVTQKEASVVPDTKASPLFHANPLLPETCAEIAAPLMLGDQVLGVLDLQSNRPHTLSDENLPAITTLAGQLAIAIDNARLFTETAQAQAEVETYARRLAQESWQEFLDNHTHRERVGYTFDHTGIVPLVGEPARLFDNVLSQAIEVVGEPIGSILIEGADELDWTADTQALVNRVAQQVAQQVESLRLLSETDRYRAEAERAIRRLTHEGWQRYEAGLNETGYLFDQNEIKPVTGDVAAEADATAVTHDLRVHGETIGRLTVSGSTMAQSTANTMATAVAQQLSAHIESLRLTAQTEEALAETSAQANRRALLNQLSEQLNRARHLEDIYDVVADGTAKILFSDRVSLAILNDTGVRFTVTSLAGEGKTVVPLGDSQPLAGSIIEKAVRTGRVVITHDDKPSTGLGIRSSMVAPLITSAGIIGTINVGSKAINVYNETDESMLLQIASILSSVVESRRLLAQVQERAEELSIINGVARAVSQQLEPEQLLETVYEHVSKVMSIDAYHISLYDAATNMLSYPIIYEDHERVEMRPAPLRSTSNTYQVMQTGKPLLIGLTEEERATLLEGGVNIIGDASKPIAASSVFVPLVFGQQVAGVLAVHSYKSKAYDDADVALLDGIAHHVAVALENARLFGETQAALAEAKRQSDELFLINRVVADITASLEIERSLQIVADELAAAIEVDAIGIALINEEESSLTVVAEHYNPKKSESSLGFKIPIEGNELTLQAINTRQTIVVEDAQNHPLTEPVHDGMRMRGIHTLYVIPMLVGNDVVGTVGVDILEQNRLLTPEQLRLAETLVFQAATAVQNARLFAESEERTRELAVINHVAETVSQQLELTQLFTLVHEQIQRAIPNDAFFVATFDAENDLVHFPYMFDDDQRYDVEPMEADPSVEVAQVIKTGIPILKNYTPEEHQQEQETNDTLMATYKAPSGMIFVPLRVGQRIIGALSVQNYNFHVYDESDVTLLSGIANHVALAMENVRLFTEAQRRAEREALINAIGQKIQNAPTVQSALQTAVTELGQSLKLKKAVIELSTTKQKNGKNRN